MPLGRARIETLISACWHVTSADHGLISKHPTTEHWSGHEVVAFVHAENYEAETIAVGPRTSVRMLSYHARNSRRAQACLV